MNAEAVTGNLIATDEMKLGTQDTYTENNMRMGTDIKSNMRLPVRFSFSSLFSFKVVYVARYILFKFSRHSSLVIDSCALFLHAP